MSYNSLTSKKFNFSTVEDESRHPTARDVMIRRHWDLQNTFEHYGSGDFDMLGWDALKISETLPLFSFADIDSRQMREQLLNSMPRELFGLASERPVSVEAIRHMFANRTAARFTDLDEVLLTLAREKEIEIRTPDGKVRSPALRRLQPDDRIAFPDTLLLPGKFSLALNFRRQTSIRAQRYCCARPCGVDQMLNLVEQDTRPKTVGSRQWYAFSTIWQPSPAQATMAARRLRGRHNRRRGTFGCHGVVQTSSSGDARRAG